MVTWRLRDVGNHFFFTYKKQLDKAGTGKTEVGYEGFYCSNTIICFVWFSYVNIEILVATYFHENKSILSYVSYKKWSN